MKGAPAFESEHEWQVCALSGLARISSVFSHVSQNVEKLFSSSGGKGKFKNSGVDILVFPLRFLGFSEKEEERKKKREKRTPAQI
jgi:hypothetical protein